MDESYKMGGFDAASLGLLTGAMTFFLDERAVNSRGGGHRKNSGEKQQGGSATVIAIGALIDGIPESAAIGISLTGGGKISAVSAAGAILTMLASTMMLEAYEEGGEVVGLVTSTGFLLAFILSRLE